LDVSKPAKIASDIQINPIELRRALGTFLTGVTIVTTRDDAGSPRGMTANSFTVSLDPPLVLICIAKSASSYEVFEASSSFAVNTPYYRLVCCPI
jgi:flavin reductase (DIM6/NTAB) family NADH-FMN oxidoreductase RutF